MVARTIAGYIPNFKFPDFAGFASTENDILVPIWSSQIGSSFAVPLQATTQAENVAGNEHLGATFTASTPLSDITADLPIPAGYAMQFDFALGACVSLAGIIWELLTTDNGRVSQSNLKPPFDQIKLGPDPKGSIVLKDLSASAQGNSITTVITGYFDTQHATGANLPNVPFTVTYIETIQALYGPPTGASVYCLAEEPVLKADTDALITAIHALEVTALGLAQLVAGIFATPLVMLGNDTILQYLNSQIPDLSGSLGLFAPLAKGIIQQVVVPGQPYKIVFHYDTVTIPQGQLAQTVKNQVVAISDAAVVTFLGKSRPVQTARTSGVAIFGQASVKIPISAGPESNKISPFHTEYSAGIEGEPQNPKFAWSLESTNPSIMQSIALTNPAGIQTTLLLNTNGRVTPVGDIVLTVVSDDDLHLKTINGQPPEASLRITVTHEAVPIPKPTDPLQPKDGNAPLRGAPTQR